MLNPKIISLSIVCILKTLITNVTKQIMIDGKAIRSTDAIKAIESMMNIVTSYAIKRKIEKMRKNNRDKLLFE